MIIRRGRRWCAVLAVAGSCLGGQLATGAAAHATDVSFGQVAYVRYTDGYDVSTLYVVNGDGTNAHPLTGRHLYRIERATWSPDGTTLGFNATLTTSSDAGSSDVFSVRSDGTGLQRLTHNGTSTFGAWSPDGTQIAFTSGSGGASNVFTMHSDGTSVHRVTHDGVSTMDSWSPDGTQLAINSAGGVSVVGLDGSLVQRITDDGYYAKWSPDGTKLTFFSNDDATSTTSVWVCAADGSNRTVVAQGANPPGVTDVEWSPDSRRLLVVRPARRAGELDIVDADGQNLHQLFGVIALTAEWTPDGRHVVYSRYTNGRSVGLSAIWRSNVNGGDAVRLTPAGQRAFYPAVQPAVGTITS